MVCYKNIIINQQPILEWPHKEHREFITLEKNTIGRISNFESVKPLRVFVNKLARSKNKFYWMLDIDYDNSAYLLFTCLAYKQRLSLVPRLPGMKLANGLFENENEALTAWQQFSHKKIFCPKRWIVNITVIINKRLFLKIFLRAHITLKLGPMRPKVADIMQYATLQTFSNYFNCHIIILMIFLIVGISGILSSVL